MKEEGKRRACAILEPIKNKSFQEESGLKWIKCYWLVQEDEDIDPCLGFFGTDF